MNTEDDLSIMETYRYIRDSPQHGTDRELPQNTLTAQKTKEDHFLVEFGQEVVDTAIGKKLNTTVVYATELGQRLTI